MVSDNKQTVSNRAVIERAKKKGVVYIKIKTHIDDIEWHRNNASTKLAERGFK